MEGEHPAVRNALEPFDKDGVKVAEHEVSTAIVAARKGFEGHLDGVPAEFDMEQVAFDFCENYDNKGSGWGLYYGPMFVSQGQNGEWIEGPSIKRVTESVLQYWEARAAKLTHPVLKCRYADLCWEFSETVTGRRPAIILATTMIDSACDAANRALYSFEVQGWTKLRRALSVAVSTSDTPRVEKVRDAVIRYEDAHAQDEMLGLWGHAFDLIMDHPKVPKTQAIEDKLIADLEGRLSRLAARHDQAQSGFAAEHAAIRLARHFRRKGRPDEVRRVLLAYGNCFLNLTKTAPAGAGCAWLERVHASYVEFGLTEDAAQILISLRDLSKRLSSEMIAHTHTMEIPREKWDQYIDSMTSGDSTTCLRRIAAHFVPRSAELLRQLEDIQKRAPLLSLFDMAIVDESGRKTATIGGHQDDSEGRLAHQMAQTMSFSQIFLKGVLSTAVTKFHLDADKLVEHLQTSPVFTDRDVSLLHVGLNLYLRGEHVAAIHVLIPQVEVALRHLLALAGGSTWKRHRFTNGFVLKNLDDSLRDDRIRSILGEDLFRYLCVLFTDQRGWNLRNNVRHGTHPVDGFTCAFSDRIVHTLLTLALIKKSEPNGAGH